MLTKTKRVNSRGAVLIAKDVLKQIRVGKFIPTQMHYLTIAVNDSSVVGKELQEELENQKVCNVCALGSLFASKVLRDDNFPIGSNQFFDIIPRNWLYVPQEINGKSVVSIDRGSIEERLTPYFTKENLAHIEYIFEGLNNDADVCIEYSEKVKLVKYRDRYETPTERLRAIMLNIIRNKGKFVLPKRVQ